LSALEQTRLDNIARNNAFLAQLNILDVNISKTNQFKETAPRKRYRSRKSESDDSNSDYVEEKEEKE
jgi:hypothetical protein